MLFINAVKRSSQQILCLLLTLDQIVNAQEEEELLAWANAVVDSYSVGSPMNEDSVQTQVNEVIRK